MQPLTGMVVCLPLMNVFWLPRDKKSLHFDDHVTWTCIPVSFVSIPIRKTLSARKRHA